MSDTPYMPFWVDAYLGDTVRLTTTEHGAYVLIMLVMWNAGGWLPDDDSQLARITGMRAYKWRKIKPTIMSFMRVDGDKFTQPRLLLELEIARSKIEKARAAGRAGGRAKALKTRKTYPGDARETPAAESAQRAGAANEPRPDEATNLDQFEAFWSAYPINLGMSKEPTLDVWKILTPEDHAAAVKAARLFRDYCSKNPDFHVVHPPKFLAERRFADVLAISAAQSAPTDSRKHYFKPGDPQWDAWAAHYRRQKGTGPPSDIKNGGWWFETEYPPQETEAAEC